MNDVITWEAQEYEHREKNPDWFWALGIIAACVSIVSVINGNFLFATFIILAAITIGFYAIRKPEIVRFEINKKGIRVRNTLYTYPSLKGFAIHTHDAGSHLLIETSRTILPIVSFPLPSELDPDRLREVLMVYVEEKELKEHTSDRVIEYLGL